MRKKGGKSVRQRELWLFLELQLDLCFWFSTLSSLSLNHFPSNHPSFHPLNNSPHTPHEHAGNSVNDNTLTLFLFTTPHHHFTRPSLPSHSPHHSSSLLTHCVQPMPMVSQTMPCKHLWSCNSHTTALLSLCTLNSLIQTTPELNCINTQWEE